VLSRSALRRASHIRYVRNSVDSDACEDPFACVPLGPDVGCQKTASDTLPPLVHSGLQYQENVRVSLSRPIGTTSGLPSISVSVSRTTRTPHSKRCDPTSVDGRNSVET